jgi:isocitrate lyase
MSREQQIRALERDWAENPRWSGVKRGYTAADVVRLRGSLQPEHTIARRGAEKLWRLVNGEAKKGYVNCLGALTAGQALQQAKAGVEAIYLSGWQVAADNNTSETMYPDQSLYAYDSVPTVVRRINNTFKRADEIQWSRGISPGTRNGVDFFLPIVADAEAGFGGVLNAFELMKNMIVAGASGVHFEDQLAAVKKCGHMGGKVLVPTQEAVQKLIAARLAADVMGVPTCCWRAPTPRPRTCSPPTWTRTTSRSSPESAPPRASSGSRTAWSRPSAAVWPMRPMPIWCGARPARRTWGSPGSLPKRA